MNYNTVKIAYLFALIIVLGGCKPEKDSKESSQAKKPNLVFILVDDLGWSDLPDYGNKFNQTPNIDALRKESMLFTDAYAASPVCSPARVAILSGQYPARVGMTDWVPGHWRPFEKMLAPINRAQELPLSSVTFGEVLKDAGYTTGYFGKWHLGDVADKYPNRQGFDSMVVYRGWGHFEMDKKLTPADTSIPDSVHSADQLTKYTVDFIKQHAGKPFAVMLSHFAVHLPLEAKQKIIEKYEKAEKPDEGINNAVYAALLESVDDGVGEITSVLSELDIEDNTIIVFYSDNGGLRQIFDKSDDILVTDNAPLRDEKGALYEGGIRVPLLIKWPGKVKPNSTSSAIMNGMDLYPTFADMLGAKMQEGHTVDGESLVPALLASADTVMKDRTTFWHYPHYHHSVPASAVRSGDYKLIEFLDDNHVELYNLKEDIGESQNLAESMPEKAAELQTLLASWRQEVDAQMPTVNADYDASRSAEWGKHPDAE